MIDILKLAARNLLRYKRRTLLTSLLITVGLTAVYHHGTEVTDIGHGIESHFARYTLVLTQTVIGIGILIAEL